MVKIVHSCNGDYIDRDCWEQNVNYWVSQGYKVMNTYIDENKIMAILNN